MEKVAMAALVIAFLVIGAGVLAFGAANGNDNDNVIYEDDEIRVEQLGEYTFKFIAKGPKTSDGVKDMGDDPESQIRDVDMAEEMIRFGEGDDAADLAVARDGWWIGNNFYYGKVVIHTFSERELTGTAENLTDADSMIRNAAPIKVLGSGEDAAQEMEIQNNLVTEKVRIYFSHTFYDTVFFIEFDPVDAGIAKELPQSELELLN